MNKTSFFPLGAILAATILAGGCSHKSDKDAASAASEISELSVSEVFKKADRSYMVVYDGDTAWLDQSTTLQWPLTIGDADLTPLQDSILRYAYAGAAVPGDPDKSILAYLANTQIDDSLATVTRVDSIPGGKDELRSWFNNVSASVMELDGSIITYQVSTSSYMGGAHPNSYSVPFTYDLRSGKVLTMDNMFRPATGDSIMAVIATALARQYEVSPANLSRAGIFVSQLTFPGSPYLTSDAVVFHYNPYDIAPYSMGPIDVTVYPYELRRFMTPELSALFDSWDGM